MLTQENIEQRNFKFYTSSVEGPSNPFGNRTDYIAKAFVGKAEYLILLQYFTSGKEEGVLRIRDFWNDPIYYPEHYFVGEVLTEAQLDQALELTRFEKFEEIDFNKIWLYK
jgi:hypothetical protein